MHIHFFPGMACMCVCVCAHSHMHTYIRTLRHTHHTHTHIFMTCTLAKSGGYFHSMYLSCNTHKHPFTHSHNIKQASSESLRSTPITQTRVYTPTESERPKDFRASSECPKTSSGYVRKAREQFPCVFRTRDNVSGRVRNAQRVISGVVRILNEQELNFFCALRLF